MSALGPDSPVACPRCGQQPKLHSDFIYAWDRERGADGRHSLVVHWYECRRWLGLRLCFRGPKNHIEKGWAEHGIGGAAWKWNNAAALERTP